MKNKLVAMVVGFALTVMAAAPAQAMTINYVYDALGRLTSANYSNNMWIGYGYDPVGNRWLFGIGGGCLDTGSC